MSHIAIFGPLVVGLAATFLTIVIHGFVVHAIVVTLRSNLQRGVLGARLSVNLIFVMSATLLALAGHLAEIGLWAFALDMSGAVARYRRRDVFIGWELHDFRFRHRIVAAMEAVRTLGSRGWNVDVRRFDRIHLRCRPTA